MRSLKYSHLNLPLRAIVNLLIIYVIIIAIIIQLHFWYLLML